MNQKKGIGGILLIGGAALLVRGAVGRGGKHGDSAL